MVIPAGVPAQRIYRDGRFWLQAPGPKFETFDCALVHGDASSLEAWGQALAAWLLK